MKANQVIEKMTAIRETNTLNADQKKYVNQVIEDFTEMGSMFEEDEDSMNEVKKFIGKFPDKPQGTPSRARGEATMAKLAKKVQDLTDRNRPGVNPRLDGSRPFPKKKSLEIEGIILDKGDEIKDKSTGKTIVFDSFENRAEGIYILGSVKGEGKSIEVHHENAHSPKKKVPKIPKVVSAVAKAKEELVKTEKEVKQEVKQAEKQAEQLIKTAEKQVKKGNVAEAKETVAEAKEVVKDAVVSATQQVKDAEKELKKAQQAIEKKAKDETNEAESKAKKAQQAIDKKAKDETREADKKIKSLKVGAFLDLGKAVIRIDTIEEKEGKMTITGKTRQGNEMKKICTVESCKITDFKTFTLQEDGFKGKQVAEMSEEQRILVAYLNISANPTHKDCQNLLIRINQFATQYVAIHGKKTNPYRKEINDVSALLMDFLKGNKLKIVGSNEESIINIVEKVEGERIYETVRIIKRFAGWAKRTVSADSIKEFIADIELAKKRKLVKDSDPLYAEVNQVEKILISMQGGGAYTFPDLGLGDVPMGLAGTRKMINQWSKEAENRAKAVIKKSPQPDKPKGFFSRIFGN